jgi:hypothetical protein
MAKNCGYCNFQGDLKSEKVLCLFDNSWHPVEDSCVNWLEYSYNMNKEDRIHMAIEARRKLDSEESSKKEKKFQIWLLILGFVLGIISTLVTQLIIKKFF